jgi:hypothetical protein
MDVERSCRGKRAISFRSTNSDKLASKKGSKNLQEYKKPSKKKFTER